MSKRINVILPEATVKVLDRVTAKGNRSRFISRAVLHYVHSRGKQSLREQLMAGYHDRGEDVRDHRRTTRRVPKRHGMVQKRNLLDPRP